jgi:hypothetical protein
LDRWLIAFQSEREESGALVRRHPGRERFPRIDYAGQHTPILLHQMLHRHIMPEHRSAEHDAFRRELSRMVTTLLPLYDRRYCKQHRERMSALAQERMRRNPSPETVLFCNDFLNYLESLGKPESAPPRV